MPSYRRALDCQVQGVAGQTAHPRHGPTALPGDNRKQRSAAASGYQLVTADSRIQAHPAPASDQVTVVPSRHSYARIDVPLLPDPGCPVRQRAAEVGERTRQPLRFR